MVEIKTLEPAIGVRKLRPRKPAARVVDQDPKLAESGSLPNQIPHPIGIRGVRTHESSSTTLDLNRVNEPPPGSRVDVCNDDMHPMSTQTAREKPAQPACTARNDRKLWHRSGVSRVRDKHWGASSLAFPGGTLTGTPGAADLSTPLCLLTGVPVA